MEARWQKCRDALGGEDRIKGAGRIYVPELSGQTLEEYDAYLSRGMFYNASARTVEGLSGAILRKPSDLEWPEAQKDALENMGVSGQTYEQIEKKTVDEVLGLGRFGHLVDAPSGKEGGEPFVSLWKAENIISWEEKEIEGRMMPVEVRLKEKTLQRSPQDEHAFIPVTRYRVLRLGNPSDRVGRDGQRVNVREDEVSQRDIYFVEIWENKSTSSVEKDNWVITDTIVPRMLGGNVLNEIPFTFINPTSLEPTPEDPPILDVVNVNLSHWRNSVDLEHGRHFTALPTGWVAGFDPKTALRIGSPVAWVAEDTDAKAGFLEFTGAGLGHLQEGMRSKEQLMAVLGARLLEESKKAAEAAETLKLRASGESSALSSISAMCSQGLTRTLKLLALWRGMGEADVSTSLNRDFDVVSMTPQMLVALMQAVQSGMTSWNTWFYNLKKGEMVPDNIDADEEAALIAAGPPGGLTLDQPEEENDETDEEKEERERKEREDEEEEEAA
jgi:hypothetical protein